MEKKYAFILTFNVKINTQIAYCEMTLLSDDKELKLSNINSAKESVIKRFKDDGIAVSAIVLLNHLRVLNN